MEFIQVNWNLGQEIAMSMVDLAIGKLSPEVEELALHKERGLGIPHLLQWERYAGHTGMIGLLNLASVVFFTDHVARLEGRNSWEGPARSSFKNLPNWETNIWLPGRFKASDAICEDGTFLGSCAELLDELAEIQRRSDLHLGVVPDAYARMRSDFTAYYRASLGDPTTVPDDDIVRWIWRGLWDGAEMAIRNRAPMLAMMG